MIHNEITVRQYAYNALYNDTILRSYLGHPMRLYWLGKDTNTGTFPVVYMSRAGTSQDYSFGLQPQSEDIFFRLKLLVDTEDAESDGYKIDKIMTQLKNVMLSIGFQLDSMSEELFEAEYKAVSVVSIWKYLNT